MSFNKYALLAATLLAGVATSAQAQVALPAAGPNDSDASLHGTGASSIQNVLVRELNCIGADQKLGNSVPSTSAPSGSLAAKSTGAYNGSPAYDCAVQDIQPLFSGKYVSTGSGFGRKMWYQFKDNYDGSPTNGTTRVFNPFNTVAGDARWSHVQFAFSDAPTSASELTLYSTGGTDSVTGTFAGAAASAGKAIQIPLFILPVAIAYNPVYGKNAAGADMKFNAIYTGNVNGVKSNAVRMTRQLYCGIFNGEITNWNNALFKPLNANKTLMDLTNDTAARWAADGVPIRLVGRMDNSGTTDVFTRHLAAICSNYVTGTNKYLKNADNLPYNGNTGVDYRSQREDTNYFPTQSSSKFAGTTNMVSGDYWDDATKTIKYIGSGPHAAPTGNVGSGLYVVANGGGQVANALNAAPDYTLGAVTLNGKVAYISADFVPPSVDNKSLSYAVLQVGTGTTYAPPSVSQAGLAFGVGSTQLLPPESDASGIYATGDTRQVHNASGALVNATRDNPLAWTEALYIPAAGNTLAAPLAGYPIVGTTQFMGYTCYAPTNRNAIVEMLGLTVGAISKDSTNNAISTLLFKGASATAPGVLVQSNIGVVPAAWSAAIRETFLKNSTQASGGATLGSKNLWIQNKYVLSTTKSPGDLTSNPDCSGKVGA